MIYFVMKITCRLLLLKGKWPFCLTRAVIFEDITGIVAGNSVAKLVNFSFLTTLLHAEEKILSCGSLFLHRVMDGFMALDIYLRQLQYIFLYEIFLWYSVYFLYPPIY
jgi:hypothetical protein